MRQFANAFSDGGASLNELRSGFIYREGQLKNLIIPEIFNGFEEKKKDTLTCVLFCTNL